MLDLVTAAQSPDEMRSESSVILIFIYQDNWEDY